MTTITRIDQVLLKKRLLNKPVVPEQLLWASLKKAEYKLLSQANEAKLSQAYRNNVELWLVPHIAALNVRRQLDRLLERHPKTAQEFFGS